jgi:NADH-quinone oxidoreductase subunit N
MLFLCANAIVVALFFAYHVPFLNLTYFNDNFLVNELFVYTKMFILIAGLCCIIIAGAYCEKKFLLHFEFVIIFLLSLQSMLLLVSANDLIFIFLCVELQAFCFYILLGLWRSNISFEATMRYFVFGVSTSLIFLLGISFLYGSLGVTNLTQIYILLPMYITSNSDNSLLIFGIALVFVGIFFKLGVVPFHL